jgi:hypothetical protein
LHGADIKIKKGVLFMLFRVIAVISLAFVLLLSGCATPTKMAFSNDADTVSKSSKPIYLMTVTLRNSYRTSYQPKLIVVHVERGVVKGSADRINFTIDDKAKNESNLPTDGNSYLLRMELEQGDYVIQGMSSMSGVFPVRGFFYAPLHANLASSDTGVFYLGHVDETIRERKGDEFKAGPSVPLLDQAVTGASGGTFDIEISDQWEKDQPKFLAKFPMLSGVKVQSLILPPFDRAKAQQMWEAN